MRKPLVSLVTAIALLLCLMLPAVCEESHVYSLKAADQFVNTWNDFLSDATWFESVKSYMYLRVRLLFDPPQNGTLMNSIEKQIDEFEWRCRTEQEFRND